MCVVFIFCLRHEYFRWLFYEIYLIMVYIQLFGQVMEWWLNMSSTVLYKYSIFVNESVWHQLWIGMENGGDNTQANEQDEYGLKKKRMPYWKCWRK